MDENDVKFPAFTVATFALSEYNPYCKQSHPFKKGRIVMSKEEYINAIMQMLEQTADTQLIDYIYTLLRECG